MQIHKPASREGHRASQRSLPDDAGDIHFNFSMDHQASNRKNAKISDRRKRKREKKKRKKKREKTPWSFSFVLLCFSVWLKSLLKFIPHIVPHIRIFAVIIYGGSAKARRIRRMEKEKRKRKEEEEKLKTYTQLLTFIPGQKVSAGLQKDL